MYDPSLFRDHMTSNEGRSAFEKRFEEVIDAGNFSSESIQLAQSYYYGLVAWIDDQAGRLLKGIEHSGLSDNTIIVFGADHGASMGEGGCWAKHIFAPVTHRVPSLIQWKGTLEKGIRREDISEGLDLARTLFGLCGIESPDSFNGRDLFFDKAPSAVYATIGFGYEQSTAFPYLHTGSYSEDKGWPRRACVRTSEYRLDKNIRINQCRPGSEEEDVFLAHIAKDPEEILNRAGDPAYSEIEAELTEMLDSHTADALEPDMKDVYKD
jgi:choline-sulfatase